MQPVRHPAGRRPLLRRGFTLIELLVVIVVIGILVALLVPAVTTSIQQARITEVVSEMSTLDASLVSFRSKLGVDVPSFIVLCEEGDHWTTDWNMSAPPGLPSGITDVHRRSSVAFIRQAWPSFDFALDRNFNDNGTPGEILVLNGSECLVFFLGGVFKRGGTASQWEDDALVGFAANPQNPFDGTGSNNRVGPFFDGFAVNRFTDLDSDNIPEFRDPLPGQLRPYVYVSSYGGNGYRPFGLDYDASTSTNPSTVDDDLSGLQYMYYAEDDDSDPSTFNAPINPQSYQLISPGFDGDYGRGGEYDGERVPTSPPEGSPDRAPERDNITNFKKGRLN